MKQEVSAECRDSLKEATITLKPKDGGFAITASHLNVTANIPGIGDATFQELAGKTKAGRPVSKLLNASITMDARRT